MILYFSGTGNSEYVAKRIAKNNSEEAINLFKKIREHDYLEMDSESSWIIVAPTYSWRIPKILEEWLEKTKLKGNKNLYFVMTCGENIGNSEKYLKKLCAKKEMNYYGCYPIVMPENYIAMFQTPNKDEALKIIDRAEEKIDEVSHLIKNEEKVPENSITIVDKISSGIVNNLFYPICVKSKKFYAKDTCITCRKCEKLCPTNNIIIESGKPKWGKDCTHCMACICHCPTNAIEYGKHSEGLPRYICPK